MRKTKYDLMQDSTYTDENGIPLPDLATFPINTFIPQKKALVGTLLEQDIYYFYNTIYKYFGAFDFYDDITLWLNDISYLESSYLESTIKIYKKEELDTWYLNNL